MAVINLLSRITINLRSVAVDPVFGKFCTSVREMFEVPSSGLRLCWRTKSYVWAVWYSVRLIDHWCSNY